MKVFKSIMLYLLILLGLATAAVLICCVIMICSPNTPILGYKYVSYKEVITDTMAISADTSAVSVTSNRMDIKIIPNAESNEVKIVYSQGMSGFVKQDAVDLEVKTTVVAAKEFESGDSSYASGATYKALCIDVVEPNGLMFLSDCYIQVFLPARTYTVINVETVNGGIEYTSNSESKTITATNLYLYSTTRDISKKPINITKPNSQRYYIRTTVGNCYFLNGGNDITGSIIFESAGGKLIAKDGAVKGALTVRSSASVNGATLDITDLYGNLTFVAKSGNISIANVVKGSNTSYPTVDIQAIYCNIKIDTLQGTIFTQGYQADDLDEIDITINNLYYASALNNVYLDSGKGNIKIGKLQGNCNLRSATGNIIVGEANCQEMFVETYNGMLNINFAEADLLLTKLDVKVLRRSSMTLLNLQGTVNIEVADGAGRDIVLGFSPRVLDNAAACTVNVLAAKDNVILQDIKSGKFAVYSDGPITSDVAQKSEITSGADYISNNPKPYQMRFNYVQGASGIYSKVFVNNNSADLKASDACSVSVYM